jgi:hypothetical protein
MYGDRIQLPPIRGPAPGDPGVSVPDAPTHGQGQGQGGQGVREDGKKSLLRIGSILDD